MFRVIIAMPREFKDYALLQRTMDRLLANVHDGIVIVCGKDACIGDLGVRYAQERRYLLQDFPSDSERYGPAADYVRNLEMADVADAVVAFWDEENRVVKHMLDVGEQHGLKTRVVRYVPFG